MIARLGYTDTSNKVVKSLKPYYRFFKLDTPDTYVIVSKKGDVYQTIIEIKKLVRETLHQTTLISQYLKGKNDGETCRNVWDFVHDHIPYKLDRDGVEELREPIRVIKDAIKNIGSDCDCMTNFVSSVLTNLRIKHELTIAKYDGSDSYSHIYIEATDSKGVKYVIDCVKHQFNVEHPFDTKKNIPMIARLGSLPSGSIPIGQEFNIATQSINGLGMMKEQEAEQMYWLGVKNMLVNALQVFKVNKTPTAQDRNDVARMSELLSVINDPIRRTQVLNNIVAMEERETGTSTVNGFAGIGSLSNNLNDIVNAHFSGLGSFGFLKIGQAIKKGATAVVSAVKNTAESAVDIVKKVGDAVMTYNPATVLLRNSMLLLLQINFIHVAHKLGFALWSDEEAKRNGLSAETHNSIKEALRKVENIHDKMGGDIESLHKNIKQGFDHGVQKHGLYPDYTKLSGLGEVATATAVATGGGLLATIATFFKNVDWQKIASNPLIQTAGSNLISRIKDQKTTNNVNPPPPSSPKKEPPPPSSPKKEDESNNNVIIGVVAASAAAIGIALVVSNNSNSNKKLNGVEENTSSRPAKAKQNRSTTLKIK